LFSRLSISANAPIVTVLRRARIAALGHSELHFMTLSAWIVVIRRITRFGPKDEVPAILAGLKCQTIITLKPYPLASNHLLKQLLIGEAF
jgi:hypothetical protein